MSTFANAIRLVFSVISLYVTFMYWGFLQEKISSGKYSGQHEIFTWKYPFVLNLCMAISTYITATFFEWLIAEKSNTLFYMFWKPALSSALASPIGYESLKYLNYPLMVLSKSLKPMPVIFIGTVFYKQRYPWYKYVSVVLLCVGITLFTFTKQSSKTSNVLSDESATKVLYGLFLILINLGLDGYTNNEQDHLFSKHSASANQMMKYVNLWQCIYQFLYLLAGYLLVGGSSELSQSVYMISQCTAVQYDIFLFCLCASVGQVLIFGLIKEFGSLVWITVSVTRQLFTIILSVVLFGHSVNLLQWFGVAIVFFGLGLEIICKYTESTHSTPASSVIGLTTTSTLKLSRLSEKEAIVKSTINVRLLTYINSVWSSLLRILNNTSSVSSFSNISINDAKNVDDNNENELLTDLERQSLSPLSSPSSSSRTTYTTPTYYSNTHLKSVGSSNDYDRNMNGKRKKKDE